MFVIILFTSFIWSERNRWSDQFNMKYEVLWTLYMFMPSVWYRVSKREEKRVVQSRAHLRSRIDWKLYYTSSQHVCFFFTFIYVTDFLNFLQSARTDPISLQSEGKMSLLNDLKKKESDKFHLITPYIRNIYRLIVTIYAVSHATREII